MDRLWPEHVKMWGWFMLPPVSADMGLPELWKLKYRKTVFVTRLWTHCHYSCRCDSLSASSLEAFPPPRDQLVGSTDHRRSCAWTPDTTDNIAVGMWSKDLIRISSCLSPCYNMHLWFFLKKETNKRPQFFTRALHVASLLPSWVFHKQTDCKVLVSWSTVNRGIGV